MGKEGTGAGLEKAGGKKEKAGDEIGDAACFGA
jgi:hypothetical protein